MKKTMKNIFKGIIMVWVIISVVGCVQDDKYHNIDTTNYQCKDLYQDGNLQLISLEEVKKLYLGKKTYEFPANSNLYIEGYVSSSDRSGNIYKTIFIQDKPENPTQGLAISVEATNIYTHYPQGAKVYVKLAGLSIGEYRKLVQLGIKTGKESSATEITRIPEKNLSTTIFRSCSEIATIVPKTLTLKEATQNLDALAGILVKVEKTEFAGKYLCSQYANTEGKQLVDASLNTSSVVAKTSSYANFANKIIPSGNGDFIGIMGRYGNTTQFYIVDDADLSMTGSRIDGLKPSCQVDNNLPTKNIAEVKQLLNGNLTKINENANLVARIIANDQTKNLYKTIYIEDATGGLRVNINATNLYTDNRFQVGREIMIKLKDLYIGKKNDEPQLGALYNGNIGQINETDLHKYFVQSSKPIINIIPIEREITQLTKNDLGRLITVKNVQFSSADIEKNYADGINNTIRTLEDCSGNTILLVTNGRADFGTRTTPLPANSTPVKKGRGNITGVLSIYNGKYQLQILSLRDIVFNNSRCDGYLPKTMINIFSDDFTNLKNWEIINISGTEVWTTTNFGNPKPSAYFDGNRKENEDWLVSKEISLVDFKEAFFSFETDGRYYGKPLEVYITTDYKEHSTHWEKVDSAIFDTDMAQFSGFVSSGKLSLNNYLGKKIRIAFKYTSSLGVSTRWELDNFSVKGAK